MPRVLDYSIQYNIGYIDITSFAIAQRIYHTTRLNEARELKLR